MLNLAYNVGIIPHGRFPSHLTKFIRTATFLNTSGWLLHKTIKGRRICEKKRATFWEFFKLVWRYCNNYRLFFPHFEFARPIKLISWNLVILRGLRIKWLNFEIYNNKVMNTIWNHKVNFMKFVSKTFWIKIFYIQNKISNGKVYWGLFNLI